MTATTTTPKPGTRARSLAAPHALAVRTGETAGNQHMATMGRRHLQRLAARFGHTVGQLLAAAAEDAGVETTTDRHLAHLRSSI